MTSTVLYRIKSQTLDNPYYGNSQANIGKVKLTTSLKGFCQCILLGLPCNYYLVHLIFLTNSNPLSTDRYWVGEPLEIHMKFHMKSTINLQNPPEIDQCSVFHCEIPSFRTTLLDSTRAAGRLPFPRGVAMVRTDEPCLIIGSLSLSPH